MTLKNILVPGWILGMVVGATGTSAFGEPPLSSQKLCEIVKTVAAENPGAIPEAARAQLVIAVTSELPDDAESDTLMKVVDEMDAFTMKQCPEDRTKLLSLLKKDTLRDALR